MYLKSLELQGFKSFAGKTRFEFRDGITGIVGPNGSGKSNVSDAVKWVLGEQSAKQLRGGKMEDVIFAGTETRKPVGFACVSITFDNRDRKLPVDYDDVTVSRKVFRSGDSEYRINDTACRLRDIEELFYDTGIGKEGYSLIGQGRIDKILNGKSDERRELFDEAAGIVKYKRRKAAAIKKLAHENDNLTRVSDILSELELRVGPLKEQSDKAREYLALRDELKKYDCNAFVLRSDKTSLDIEELESKIEIAQNDFKEASEVYESTKEEYSAAEARLEELDTRQEENRRQSDGFNREIQETSARLGILQEQIRSLRSNSDESGDTIERLKTSIPEKEKEIEAKKAERSEMAAAIKKISEDEKSLESSISLIRNESSRIEMESDTGNVRILDCVQDQSNEKTQIALLESKIADLKDAVEEENKLEGQRKELLEKNVLLISSAQDAFDKANVRYQELAGRKEDLTGKIQKNSGEEARDAGKLYDIRTGLVKKTSEIDSLKAVTERYDGYAESIRRIMEANRGNNDINGVVADIIKTEPSYETAIETALGGALQNIVTDTEAQAKRLVEFLKKERAGRATFLPLDAIRPRGGLNLSNLTDEKGFIGIGSDLVSVDDKYAKLAEFLLGRTVIADTIDNALKIAKNNHYSLKIVTLEGEQLNPGGSLTGGAFRHAGNLLSRRRVVEEGEKELAALNAELARYEKLTGEHTALKKKLKQEFDEISEDLIKAGMDRNTASINLQVAKEKAEEIALDGSETKLGELRKQIRSLNDELDARRRRLKTLEEDEIRIRKENDLKKDEAQSTGAKLEELLASLSKLRLSSSSLLQKDGFLAEELLRLEKEKNGFITELNNFQARQTSIGTTVEEKIKKEEEEKKGLSDLNAALADLAEDEEKIRQARHELSETHKAFFAKREAISETINSIDKELFRLNARKEKLDEALEELTEYMWREYELTYSYALEQRDEELADLGEITRHADKLRSKIKSLGPVNVNAIEEFKETNGRYEFLSQQHKDLIEATDSLKNIIYDLDTGMRKQFAEKFNEINKEFSEVFKKLFGGGKGSVSIQEDVDILDADIIVSAQPPGKKLQNMLQLSGGERALTAIALLFAIQNLKPSPFCLLDEIEAALDDANVGRFAGFLGQLSNNTQYIVITHRRGTMAVTDRLYGITMQEKGVSTLVSVELKK